jgi:hypothetical protein
MIFDAGNLFLDKKAASTYGTTAAYSDNVVANTGGGNAEEACWLVVVVSEAATAGGNLTITLQTSDAEAFSSGVVDLFSKVVATGGIGEVVAVRVPVGAKKFFRLKLQGSASITGNGKITAGLVADADIKA